MKAMIVGGQGQLGQKMLQTISRETDWEIVSVIRGAVLDQEGYESFDTASRAEWKRIMMEDRWKPNVIINAAAMTDVDGCETHREEAWRTNVQLVEIVTNMARNIEAKLIQISTDYIFDGNDGPYTEVARPNPINYYGKTKLAAENVCSRNGSDCAIIRTMWLYGHTQATKRNFIEWILEQLEDNEPIRVVEDEIGNPTLTDDLAYTIIAIIEQDIKGIINVAGDELVSRKELARQIAMLTGHDADRILGIRSSELQRAARRPLKSGLITLKARSLVNIKSRSLVDGLTMYMTQRRRMEEMAG